MNIKSTIAKITDEIFNSKCLTSAKTLFIEHIINTNIKDKDKTKMINDVDKINSLYKLQYYCANSLLKYEGLSLSRPEKE